MGGGERDVSMRRERCEYVCGGRRERCEYVEGGGRDVSMWGEEGEMYVGGWGVRDRDTETHISGHVTQINYYAMTNNTRLRQNNSYVQHTMCFAGIPLKWAMTTGAEAH